MQGFLRPPEECPSRRRLVLRPVLRSAVQGTTVEIDYLLKSRSDPRSSSTLFSSYSPTYLLALAYLETSF